jgi:hypothetical protein
MLLEAVAQFRFEQTACHILAQVIPSPRQFSTFWQCHRAALGLLRFDHLGQDLNGSAYERKICKQTISRHLSRPTQTTKIFRTTFPRRLIFTLILREINI